MTTPTQHAIVGSGHIGSALARLFARAGLEVSLANTRGPSSLTGLAASIGPKVRPVSLAQALESETIFVAVPFGSVEQLGTSLGDWTGKTVVDTTNAHYTLGSEQVLQGLPSTHYVADQLPGATVVKAFNQLPAATLQAELDRTIGRRVIFVATDEQEAGDRIAALVDALGLAAVQLGPIDQGGLLIEAPHSLVLRNLVERPLV